MRQHTINVLLFVFLDAFLEKIPKSPVRELLEMEPETAKFEWVLTTVFLYSVMRLYYSV
jgi:hypothetical protein